MPRDQDEADGTIHLLHTAAGSCSLVAHDADEFRSHLAGSAWVTDHLAAPVVADFLTNDLRLEPGQIYSWKLPPVLGGEYELANAEASDVAVHSAPRRASTGRLVPAASGGAASG
jgi:hypothetical protein